MARTSCFKKDSVGSNNRCHHSTQVSVVLDSMVVVLDFTDSYNKRNVALSTDQWHS